MRGGYLRCRRPGEGLCGLPPPSRRLMTGKPAEVPVQASVHGWLR
jgi:hypothetical protein